MKYLILILSISLNSYASYIPESKIGQSTDGMKIYSKQKKCESKYGEDCIKIKENNSYSKIIEEQILEENKTVCIIDCKDELEVIECSEGYYPKEGLMTVYCEKIIPRHIGNDQVKKDQYDLIKKNKKDSDRNKRDSINTIKKKKWKKMSEKQKDDVIEYLIERMN